MSDTKAPLYIHGLSMVIPSYNRESQLLRLLDTIAHEDTSDVYEIIVIDNNSDYDISEAVNTHDDLNIRIIKNSFNIEMSTNMMSAFMHCRTKWLWILSDDDTVCDGSVRRVVEDVKKYNTACYLKYSSEGIGANGQEKDEEVSSLEAFIDYYHGGKPVRTGNLVFVSNGVYNLESLYPYLGKGFEYSYTYIPYLIPVLFALKNGCRVQFRRHPIVKFMHPEGESWSFTKVGLGLSTLSHIDFDLSDSYRSRMYRVFMVVPYVPYFLHLIRMNVSRPRYHYALVYDNIYKYHLSLRHRIAYHLLRVSLLAPNAVGLVLGRMRRVYKPSKT